MLDKPRAMLDRPRAMKNCDVLYHFHNTLNLDVFLIWRVFLLIFGRGVPMPIDLSTNCAMLHGTK